eukprot:Pgem_evm1s8393
MSFSEHTDNSFVIARSNSLKTEELNEESCLFPICERLSMFQKKRRNSLNNFDSQNIIESEADCEQCKCLYGQPILRRNKRVSFNHMVSATSTYSSEEYSRKNFIQKPRNDEKLRIRQEVIYYKITEMVSHPDSVGNINVHDHAKRKVFRMQKLDDLYNQEQEEQKFEVEFDFDYYPQLEEKERAIMEQLEKMAPKSQYNNFVFPNVMMS